MIVIDAGINPATADFIHESLLTAARGGAQALIIELDTPGGLLDSTKSIVKDLLGAPLPVIVYVAPSGAGAASAGVFVTMAANVAAMAPGTNIGAAHPVGGQGENIGGDMGEKVENFAASLSKTIAHERGRNVEWAMKFAREAEAGNLHVNWGSQWRVDLMPYGGLKDSGFGKEGPRYAVEEMTELKMVVFHLNS